MVMMERVTMEQALFRQQIVAIRDWDAYQASLHDKAGRRWPMPASLTKQAAPDSKQKTK